MAQVASIASFKLRTNVYLKAITRACPSQDMVVKKYQWQFSLPHVVQASV
jgi:hypothetical protein